jgi:hypothetical protein
LTWIKKRFGYPSTWAMFSATVIRFRQPEILVDERNPAVLPDESVRAEHYASSLRPGLAVGTNILMTVDFPAPNTTPRAQKLSRPHSTVKVFLRGSGPGTSRVHGRFEQGICSCGA